MSKKKVLVLLGSPRKEGSSASLARCLAEGAQSAGAEVEEVVIQDLDIRPCAACEACHKEGSKGCVVKDDMPLVYEKLLEADAIVFASPVYWFTFSGQTKLVIDRFYALESQKGNALAGKHIGILLSYGDRDPVRSGAVNALRTFQDVFRYIGAEIVGTVYGTGLPDGRLVNGEELAREARELGTRLARAS
ncbi:MAG: flavodoxin family protein [Candidatus Bipolaricaulota bacterium]|jgi:multimeric flavodoxin WrbA|nr:flavodoxin family protein [Candidatus Bipolaricaulota bacterium]